MFLVLAGISACCKYGSQGKVASMLWKHGIKKGNTVLKTGNLWVRVGAITIAVLQSSMMLVMSVSQLRVTKFNEIDK